MDKYTMIYLYKKLLFNNKKEHSSNTGNSVDESQKQSVEWKKPESKKYIVFDSIFMKF